MAPFHVVLESSRDWIDYVPAWISAVASLITFCVAVFIAHNQNRLQIMLADRQRDVHRTQDEQQERQLKKDLYDRRFGVFTEVRNFIAYALQNDGKIQLPGPEYGQFKESMEHAQMLFGDDVNRYLVSVDKTVRALYASAQTLGKAIATGDVDAIDKNSQLLTAVTDLLARRVEVFRPHLQLFH